jgi:hypothetical protein
MELTLCVSGKQIALFAVLVLLFSSVGFVVANGRVLRFSYPYSQPLPNPGHGGDTVWVDVFGNEMTLQDAISAGLFGLPSCSEGQTLQLIGGAWTCVDAIFGTVAQDCTLKRTEVQTLDSVVFCDSDYPVMFSCNLIDNEAADASPTSLAGYCETDGFCSACPTNSGACSGRLAPEEFRRSNLGRDNTYLESVVNSAGVQGCWQYDYAHTRLPYRLEITCCKSG